MTGNVAVADKFLSFLPHRVSKTTVGPSGTPTTSTVDVDAASMNPGFLTPTGVTRHDPLQQIVNRRVLGRTAASRPPIRLDSLRFGLVDLTGAAKLKSPEYAGHKDLVQGGLGSLAKTACMWACYQLKFDLEDLAKTKGLTTAKDLFDAARDRWNDTQQRDASNASTLFPSGPKIELLGKLIEIDGKSAKLPRGLSSPDLERIFDVAPDGAGGVTVKFKGSDDILVDPKASPSAPHISDDVRAFLVADKEKLDKVRALSFAERLFLMIDESDNAACHSVMENVSFLYIASALWQADIYRPERGGGLWEASTHFPKGVRWIMPPVPRGARGADFVSATAASVSALITLIEQGRLVNPDACDGMKQLMSKKKSLKDELGNAFVGSLTRSFFEDGFNKRSIKTDRMHSKLGIGDFLNDGAIIERTIKPDPTDPTKDRQIRYVATGFDAPDSAAGVEALGALIEALDECIQEHNGLLPGPTPPTPPPSPPTPPTPTP